MRLTACCGYYNARQDCTAACRIYAQVGIHDKLVTELGAAVSSLRFAGKRDADNEIGPLNSHFMLVSEMPHGGLKRSGYDKDLSSDSLQDYSVVRHIMARHSGQL